MLNRAITISCLLALTGPATADNATPVRGEVIIIEERVPPAVLPKPKNYSKLKAPPYSEKAILADAWTKAWLLLDVNKQGEVERLKFLKSPGYDLEAIAQSEASKLRFEPGRDRKGNPVRTWIVWEIEWPSVGWLVAFVGTRSSMPPYIGYNKWTGEPRRLDENVPCAGSGPLVLDSYHPVYKDCSRPDLSKANSVPWIGLDRSGR